MDLREADRVPAAGFARLRAVDLATLMTTGLVDNLAPSVFADKKKEGREVGGDGDVCKALPGGSFGYVYWNMFDEPSGSAGIESARRAMVGNNLRLRKDEWRGRPLIHVTEDWEHPYPIMGGKS